LARLQRYASEQKMYYFYKSGACSRSIAGRFESKSPARKATLSVAGGPSTRDNIYYTDRGKSEIMSQEQILPPPPAPESSVEAFPTMKDVRSILERLIGEGVEFKEVRTRADKKGLYLWDVRIKQEDGEAEYSYMRKGRYPEGAASKTAIHVAFYDVDGMPTGGEEVARLENGAWKVL
jgi:hypothetical protein